MGCEVAEYFQVKLPKWNLVFYLEKHTKTIYNNYWTKYYTWLYIKLGLRARILFCNSYRLFRPLWFRKHDQRERLPVGPADACAAHSRLTCVLTHNQAGLPHECHGEAPAGQLMQYLLLLDGVETRYERRQMRVITITKNITNIFNSMF